MACCGGFLAASSFGVAVPLDAMGPVRVINDFECMPIAA